jgi:oligopeptide/dipeptide ABC transporter ATP-binding protein
MPDTCLSVRNLTVDFIMEGGAPARALEDVRFEVGRGEMLGLVGESGCGKSTTLMALMRLLPATGRIVSGEALFEGRDLWRLPEREMRAVRWGQIAMVFQGAMNALNPVEPVGSQIGEAIRLHETVDGSAVETRVDELLDRVGIARSRKRDYPHQFSGGMRQRVMIAMALACRPSLLLADEPTTALDVMVQAQVLELLKTIRRDLGLAVILVTHDLGVVAEACDRVAVMYGGRVAETGTTEAVFNHPAHPYTQRLLDLFPDVHRPATRLASIPGMPPRLNALPLGCRFAPRCHAVMDVCHTRPPELVRVPGAGPAHEVACYWHPPSGKGAA